MRRNIGMNFRSMTKIAKIDYIKSNNGEIYLVHTEVPASLGGRGVGSQLAEKTLAIRTTRFTLSHFVRL